MRHRWFKNFFLSGSISLLIYTFFEIAVRVLVWFYPYYDVEMWRYGTLFKQRSSEPEMSHRHIPNQSANLYGVEISINSKGLRDREFEYDKKPGVYRILFLGDSLTLGWGVEFDDLFSKRLEPALSNLLGKPTEVINTGVGNYNTEQEWTYYKTEGSKYNSDEVMLLYFINDAEPTPIYSEATLKENSMLLVFLWSRIKKILVKFGQTKNFLNYYNDLYLDEAEGWRISRESLIAIRNTVQEKGNRFLVIVCPELRSFRSAYPFRVSHEKIIDFLNNQGIQSIDLLPIFRKKISNEKNVWVSWEDSHPNALGHKVIADGIFEYYRKHLLLPKKTNEL